MANATDISDNELAELYNKLEKKSLVKLLVEKYRQSENQSKKIDCKSLLIAWIQYKKGNWWKSRSIDVEKVLMRQFLNIINEETK